VLIEDSCGNTGKLNDDNDINDHHGGLYDDHFGAGPDIDTSASGYDSPPNCAAAGPWSSRNSR
jgi:hypothetical protein